MPILALTTNVDQNKINDNILKDASKLMADLFDGTEQNVLISIRAAVKMQWGTKPGSYALGALQNTTPFHSESDKTYAPKLFEFVEKSLGVPQNRMYIGILSVNPDNLATDGIITSLVDEL